MPTSTENEPVNLLACDGGGIRGVSELVVLDELMKTIQQRGDLARLPKPCEYFHLMGGTSTGGLVAIMLGRLEMSTTEALDAYDAFAQDIFCSKNRNYLSINKRYNEGPLEDTIRTLVDKRNRGTTLRDSRPATAKGRTFVCTMPQTHRATTVRLRSYEIPKDRFPATLIYEAARATTAASTFFAPMVLRDDQGVSGRFVDAALGTNNPGWTTIEEARELFGTARRLGCMVSLGTGSKDSELADRGQRWELMQRLRAIRSVLNVAKDLSTDVERDHKQMETLFRKYPQAYFRFQVERGAQDIKLNHWKKIGLLKKRTQEYLQEKEVRARINELADTLLGKDRSENGHPPHGLTLGHIGELDGTQIKLDNQVAQPRGRASTIFTGREFILKKLDQYFKRKGRLDSERKEFHLWGMGGVGKTQIALKFAEDCERRGYKIFWVDATDTVTAEQSLLRIAEAQLDANERSGGVADIVRLLHKIAAMEDDWLLVFDNAPDKGLLRNTPDGNTGNILYTSREEDLERRLGPGCKFNVEQMDVSDALTLLLRSAEKDEDNKEFRDLARPIVDALGCLPLALDQAGAYINMVPCPLDNFLDVYNQQKDSLLKRPRFKGQDNDRNLPVYATFNISYIAIQDLTKRATDRERAKEARHALQLLNLLCFYHNEGVIGPMFDYAAQNRHTHRREEITTVDLSNIDGDSLEHFLGLQNTKCKWDGENFELGIKFLKRFSLLKYDDSNRHINMHVLVHEWARGRMEDKKRLEWGQAARCILLDSIDVKLNREHVAHRREMLPHLDACSKLNIPLNDGYGLEADRQLKIARTFEDFDRIADAADAYGRAVRYGTLEWGRFAKQTISFLANKASFHDSHGQFAQAEEFWLEAIERRRVANEEGLLIVSEAKRRRRPPSECGAGFGIIIAGATHVMDDYDLRADTASLATWYFRHGRYDCAQRHVSEILEWDKYYRKSGSETGEDLCVVQARKLDDHIARRQTHASSDQVQAECVEALAKFGEGSYEYMKSKNDLAETLVREANREKDAQTREDKLFRADNIMAGVCKWMGQAYGPTGRGTLEATGAWGRIVLQRRRPYEALCSQIAALVKHRAVLGKSHPATLKCQSDIARCLMAVGAFGLGLDWGKRCLVAMRGVFDENSREVRKMAALMRQLLEYYQTMPRWARVRWIQRAALDERECYINDEIEMPRFLMDWKPELVQPPLTATGDEIRIVYETIHIEGDAVETCKQIGEPAGPIKLQPLKKFLPEQYINCCEDEHLIPGFSGNDMMLSEDVLAYLVKNHHANNGTATQKPITNSPGVVGGRSSMARKTKKRGPLSQPGNGTIVAGSS